MYNLNADGEIYGETCIDCCGVCSWVQLWRRGKLLYKTPTFTFSHSVLIMYYADCISYQPGGLGDETPVASNDTEIFKLMETVKSDVIKALQLSSNAALTPKSVSKQIVAGTNYFIKVFIINS